MRTVPALLALFLTFAAAPALSAPAATVTATLDVDLFGVDYKTCAVDVATGSNVGDLLDAAVAQGCIDEWSHDSYPGFGRYVTSIDHIPAAVATYWAFYVDGAYATKGVDDTTVQDAHTYGFDYVQWLVEA